MKTITQTKFSLFYADGTRLTYGNCLVACIASILEESIDEIPNVYTFYGLDDRENKNIEDHWWFKILNIWLKEKHKKCIKYHELGSETDQQYVIMRGLSARGKPHTCIFENRDSVLLPFFDPHPTKQYLTQEHYFYTIENIWKASI